MLGWRKEREEEAGGLTTAGTSHLLSPQKVGSGWECELGRRGGAASPPSAPPLQPHHLLHVHVFETPPELSGSLLW